MLGEDGCLGPNGDCEDPRRPSQEVDGLIRNGLWFLKNGSEGMKGWKGGVDCASLISWRSILAKVNPRKTPSYDKMNIEMTILNMTDLDSYAYATARNR